MSTELTLFLLGAAFNLAVALIIVRLIYYPGTQDRRYVFTFLAFNAMVFFVMSVFTRVELGLGAGFGLFALFSILRYRTEEIPIREMTYLFVVIALPIMNSILLTSGDLAQLLLANAGLAGLLFALEHAWGFRFEASQRLTYERIELIGPARRAELLADLRERTGLPIRRVEIGRVDLSRDTADLKVFYPEAQSAK